MVVENDFNLRCVHFQKFTKRTAFAHGHAALAQRAVAGFHDAGLAFAFGTRPVLVAGQHLGVVLSLVGEVPAASPVTCAQLLPKAAGRGVAPAAQRRGHNAPADPFNSQPEPDLALLAPDERPQLVEFEHFPALFLPVWPPSCAPPRSPGQCCVACYVRPAARPLARTARPWPQPRVLTAPGGGRLCIGTGCGPSHGHGAEFGRCRISRKRVE